MSASARSRVNPRVCVSILYPCATLKYVPPTPPLSLCSQSVPLRGHLGILQHDPLSITRMPPPEGLPTPGRPFPAPSITCGEHSDANADVKPASDGRRRHVRDASELR